MESLPDEALQKIFSYLSILERLTYESVCRRWRASISYRTPDEIDLVREFLMPRGRLKKADTFPMTPALRSFLKRAGPYLKSISFGKSNLLVPFTVINKLDECCPNLECLDLSFCTVTEQIVPALTGLADRLKSLNLGNTAFTVWQADHHVDNLSILFASMSRLESINMQRTNVNNLLAVPHIPDTLKRLNLNACSPMPATTLFDLLAKCIDLEELRLSAYSRNVNSHIVQAVCTLPRLRILDISRQPSAAQFSADGGVGDWKHLARVITLQELYAQYNDAFTDPVLESISRCCRNLRVLNVSNCRGISTFSTWLPHLGDNLVEFYVAANDRLTDTDTGLLAEQAGPNLRVFHVPACPCLSGLTLKALATFCPNLVDLNVGQCEAMENDDVEMLMTRCRKLEVVDLRASRISDRLFIALDDFREANEVNAPSKNNVGRILSRCRSLDISYCSDVTDVGATRLCGLLIRTTGRRKNEPITVYVHQTRVTKVVLENLENGVVQIQF